MQERGKHPRTAHGFEGATTDEAQIRTWWTTWPTANIAIPTGRKSRIGVLDSGPRHGAPADRDDLFEHLRTLFGPIPETGEAITGRRDGGRHIYFAIPDSHPNVSAVAKGIEFKGDGTYVIVRPSMHCAAGRYE
jgi:hypothetical protein